MPFRVVCHHCGYVFYKGMKPPRLYEIYAQVGGRCPRCGRKVTWMPVSITVKRSGASKT